MSLLRQLYQLTCVDDLPSVKVEPGHEGICPYEPHSTQVWFGRGQRKRDIGTRVAGRWAKRYVTGKSLENTLPHLTVVPFWGFPILHASLLWCKHTQIGISGMDPGIRESCL